MIDPHAASPVFTAGVALSEASFVMVLLHGRGGSARDMIDLGLGLSLSNATIVAPQASGQTWYPHSFLATKQANEPYLSSALAKVESVVKSIEQTGFGREKIVVGGFSQGACLATEFVASHPARYRGLIAFTGGLIGPEAALEYDVNLLSNGMLAGTPALLSSGDPDPHVPWTRVEESAAILRAMGAEVVTKCFRGRPHTITKDELELARQMLLSVPM